jgi:hypothetical protein
VVLEISVVMSVFRVLKEAWENTAARRAAQQC